MYPNSICFGPKVLIGIDLRPKNILFGYMDPSAIFAFGLRFWFLEVEGLGPSKFGCWGFVPKFGRPAFGHSMILAL